MTMHKQRKMKTNTAYHITFTPNESTFIVKRAIESSINYSHTCGTITTMYYYGECDESVSTAHDAKVYSTYLLQAIDNHSDFSSTVQHTVNAEGVRATVPAECASGTYEMAAYFMCDSGTWVVNSAPLINSVDDPVAAASYGIDGLGGSGTVTYAPMYFYGYGYIEVTS